MAINFEYYARNPIDWIEKYTGARLWSKQQEICDAVANNSKVSVRSGHGVGKSFVAACITLWFLFTHPYSTTVTTAPTFHQVKEILWQEIAKLHAQSSER